MRIAAQLYTLREHLRTPEQIASSLKKVKEIGYHAVQVSGMGEIRAEALQKLVEQYELTICATHIPYEKLNHHLDEVIAQHRMWNCTYVGLGAMPIHFRSSLDGYVKFAAEANEIGKKLADAGLSFIYHNHHFEFAKFDGRTGMDILLEETDRDAVGFELDVYWVQAGGADPVEWIHKVEGRMDVVHFKDMAVTPEGEQRFAEVGSGNMNFSAIIDACRKTGVQWAAVEQDHCYDKDPFDCLQTSYQYLQRFGFA